VVAYAPIPEVFLRAGAGRFTKMHAHKINTADVVSNVSLCREHHRLTLRVSGFQEAFPGQFVHLGPERSEADHYRTFKWGSSADASAWNTSLTGPFLRRAFSIAGLRAKEAHVQIEVIHRIVGKATRWLATLKPRETVSVMGPLGNRFPVVSGKRHAWLVAGGVGLPPMLWLAELLRSRGISATALCGAQSKDLLPLALYAEAPPDPSARRAAPSAEEFARHDIPVVISTDDGSLGFRGHVGDAMAAFYEAQSIEPADLVVYTCGPERMMAFVAGFCAQVGIECYACLERAMACGTGMCQSCVVPVRDTGPGGWRYRLCCTEGPVFPAGDVLWHDPAEAQ